MCLVKPILVIFIPEEKVLVAGDVLFYHRTPGFQDAGPLGNKQALQFMRRFGAHYVVPGHGPVTDEAGMTWMID